MKITMRTFTYVLLLILYMDVCIGANYTYYVNAQSEDEQDGIPIGTTTQTESMVVSTLKIEPSYMWGQTGGVNWIKTLSSKLDNGGSISDIDGDGILNENDLDIDGDGVSNEQEYWNLANLKTDMNPNGEYTGGYWKQWSLNKETNEITKSEFISDNTYYTDPWQNEKSPINFKPNPTSYTTLSGGEIQIDTGSVSINREQIIYYPNPTRGYDRNGNEFAIYRATFPFEFSFQVKTLFDYNEVNPYGTIGYQCSDEESSLAVGRLYFGDKLDSPEKNGWRDHGAYDSILVPKVTGSKRYLPDKDFSVLRTTQESPAGTKYYSWDDGDEYFKLHKYYASFHANSPYIKLGNPSVDGSGWSTYDYSKQKNAMVAYEASPMVDIGSFGLSYRLKLDPFVLGSVRLYEGDNGEWIKQTDTKVEIVSAQILQYDPNGDPAKKSGYLGELTDVQNFFDNTPFDRESADLKEQEKPTVPKNEFIGTAVEYSLASVPLSSQYSFSDAYGGDISFSLGQPRLYSRDLQKYQIDFTPEEQQKSLQYLDWNMEMTGFQITPRVQLVKKSTFVDYKEAWWDEDVGANQLYRSDNRLFEIPSLAGWQVVNSWLEQRVRVWVDMYARIPIDENFLGQSDDSEDQSKMPPPNNPIGMRLWDTSNYGTIDADVVIPHPLNDLGLLLDQLLENWWIILIIIIAIVGAFIVVTLTRSKITSSGSDLAQLIKLEETKQRYALERERIILQQKEAELEKVRLENEQLRREKIGK